MLAEIDCFIEQHKTLACDITGVQSAREHIKYLARTKKEKDVHKLEEKALQGVRLETDKHLKMPQLEALLKTLKRY